MPLSYLRYWHGWHGHDSSLVSFGSLNPQQTYYVGSRILTTHAIIWTDKLTCSLYCLRQTDDALAESSVHRISEACFYRIYVIGMVGMVDMGMIRPWLYSASSGFPIHPSSAIVSPTSSLYGILREVYLR
jgi:hypothetical protein